MQIHNGKTESQNINHHKANNIVKNRLIRVYLINSYSKAQVHKLDLDGNTVLTGHNTSGKTTFMGAVLPFYGVAPSNIAKHSENTKKFADFYLHQTNSYIVYEYLRNGLKHCVLLRNNNSIITYNLINGAYEDCFFLTENSNNRITINEYHEIRQRIQNANIYISKDLVYRSYEAIITNRRVTNNTSLTQSIKKDGAVLDN